MILSLLGCRPAIELRRVIATCGTVATLLGCSDGVAPAGPEVQDQGAQASLVASQGIAFLPFNLPIDLTPDGRIALLQDGASREVDLYFFDTRSGKLELKAHAGDPLSDFATGISSGGRISALHGTPAQPGLWTEGKGWLDLGSPYRGCPGAGLGGAWDVSADGKVTVGLLWNGCAAEAFRWTDASGTGVFTRLQVLGSRPGSTAPSNRATVVSDDGRIAAGFAEKVPVDRWPAVWRVDGTGMLLPLPSNGREDAPGEVLSITSDGRVVAGTWNGDGFYWSMKEGTVNIGKCPTSLPSDPTYPNAIAAGGHLIFGGCGDAFFTVPVAFVWTAAEGMKALQDIATAHGVVIPPGYLLANVMAASADGSVLLGTAFDANFNTVSFVMRLPVTAYGL